MIRSLPSNKAPGMDKISSRILKDSLPSTLTTITHIVNNSFVTNTFARAWKTAEVTPILKCGNPDVPNNYRPISLLPIVSKVTERLVHGQLMEHLIRNNKLAAHPSYNISIFPRVRWIGFRVTFLTDNSAFELVTQFLKYSHVSSEFRKALF